MRPQSISILCVLLIALGASLAIRFVVQFALAPNFYSFLMLAISLLGLYSYYGLWNMRRRSIPLFLGVWVSILLILLILAPEITLIMMMRVLYIIAIIAIFIVVVFPHREKFSRGPIWQPTKNTE